MLQGEEHKDTSSPTALLLQQPGDTQNPCLAPWHPSPGQWEAGRNKGDAHGMVGIHFTGEKTEAQSHQTTCVVRIGRVLLAPGAFAANLRFQVSFGCFGYQSSLRLSQESTGMSPMS